MESTELIRRRMMGKKGILPQGYEELELLTNPKTAFFNTGVYRGETTLIKVVTKIRWNAFDSTALMFSDNGVFVGTRGNGEWCNANINATSLSAQLGVLYDVTMERTSLNEQVLTVNGTSVTTVRAQTGNNYTYLFNIGNTTPYYKCLCSMGRTQIYSDGVLVRDFVPCINPNNVYGMYDLITSVFYSSQGSVQFTGE